MIVDIQLNPATEPWESIRDGVALAEDAGFTTAWVFDHFAGKLLRGHTMLECFTLLGAMAASTTTIGIGSLVVNVANRNPGVMAMGAASVQAISNGRFVLGLGAGAAPSTPWSWEHRDLGIELAPTIALRHARLAHALDELDRLWHPAPDAEVTTFPVPVPPPPTLLGVNSTALARLAAERTDGINIRGDHAELAEILGAASAARSTSARADQPMIVSVWSEWDEALVDPDHPSRRRWAELGVNRLVLTWLRPHDPASVARVGGALIAQR
jgi:alkanesulfonate monooxygenase SsuD/methylene tetrahydromethanopterin reductase-like flavin-dependent oxidoreductase (luciferase family)